MGAVLGVDVGFSPVRRSSAACRLHWTAGGVGWTIRRFRAVTAEREATIAAVAGDGALLAAAFDGPLRRGLDVIGRYRLAERMLTRRLGALVGKPGQSSTPTGRQLNAAANDCAGAVLRLGRLAPASFATRIHADAIAEAFPSGFLGVMLREPGLVPVTRADRSDRFYEQLAADGTLGRLLAHLLPGRALAAPLEDVRNHDDRAALVCALAALGLAAGDFTAVGGPGDGWIVLPPRRFVQGWAWAALEANAGEMGPGCLYDAAP